jgi:L-ascorbate metabolism protein UlaG (beta-lactamase superfamily)
MKVTKFGHCCLLIEDNGVRVLTDPGNRSEDRQNDVQNLDAVIITHDHEDHLHIESLEAIMKNNPQAVIITNSTIEKNY